MEIVMGVIPTTPEITAFATEEDEPIVFRNYYRCERDGTEWSDDWSCMCNDRCPTCDAEISPYYSEDIDNSRIAAYLNAYRNESPVPSRSSFGI